MIKHINHQNFLTTPFVAVKSWELLGLQNDEAVITEEESGSIHIADFNIALDYVDYNFGDPVINRDCNIALEQQETDIIRYQEGVTGSGAFTLDDPQNIDGTYKSLVHNQTHNAFYNKRQNPTQIFGVEYIDFPLSRTERNLSDYFRIFTIPTLIFGERMVPYSIHLTDNALDDNVSIHDDGYQNLHAGFNLFSKVQEVRKFPQEILEGTASCDCTTFDNKPIPVTVSDTGSLPN